PGPPRGARLGGPREDLVVDVGDVADVGDLETAALEPAHQHVEGDEGAQVPQVGRALRGRAADVQRHRPLAHRGQRCGGAGGGVVQLESHVPRVLPRAGPMIHGAQVVRGGPGRWSGQSAGALSFFETRNATSPSTALITTKTPATIRNAAQYGSPSASSPVAAANSSITHAESRRNSSTAAQAAMMPALTARAVISFFAMS